MTRNAGTYYIVGYGGKIDLPTIDMITTEKSIVGNLVGTYPELVELMALADRGLVNLATRVPAERGQPGPQGPASRPDQGPCRPDPAAASHPPPGQGGQDDRRPGSPVQERVLRACRRLADAMVAAHGPDFAMGAPDHHRRASSPKSKPVGRMPDADPDAGGEKGVTRRASAGSIKVWIVVEQPAARNVPEQNMTQRSIRPSIIRANLQKQPNPSTRKIWHATCEDSRRTSRGAGAPQRARTDWQEERSHDAIPAGEPRP